MGYGVCDVGPQGDIRVKGGSGSFGNVKAALDFLEKIERSLKGIEATSGLEKLSAQITLMWPDIPASENSFVEATIGFGHASSSLTVGKPGRKISLRGLIPEDALKIAAKASAAHLENPSNLGVDILAEALRYTESNQ